MNAKEFLAKLITSRASGSHARDFTEQIWQAVNTDAVLSESQQNFVIRTINESFPNATVGAETEIVGRIAIYINTCR